MTPGLNSDKHFEEVIQDSYKWKFSQPKLQAQFVRWYVGGSKIRIQAQFIPQNHIDNPS